MNSSPVPPKTDVPAPATRRGDSPAERMAAILEALGRGNRFLICSHARPDGDAVGSMLALGMVLEQMGKQADLVTADRIPEHYRWMPGSASIRAGRCVEGSYDAALLLECDSVERTGLRGLEAYPLVNIDHHVSGQTYARVNWIDPQAVSVGEMVYRLAQAAQATITPEMASCLYTTILTDTGGFCYGPVRESTFALAQELVKAGANAVTIAESVYYNKPVSKMLLLGAALHRLTRRGRVAWLWVTHQDVVRSCATEEDCEGIVNMALGMEGIDAAVFLRELPEGRIRLSLRGKSGVNVVAIAARLGGGGHENAAGCTLDGPVQHALAEILTELRGVMAHTAG
jgi:bifunctional oligoribonuclease and PAP phosphatase NrnA